MTLLARIRDGESLSLYYKMIDVDARDFIQNDRFWGPTCNLDNALLNQPEMSGNEVHSAIVESFKKYRKGKWERNYFLYRQFIFCWRNIKFELNIFFNPRNNI